MNAALRAEWLRLRRRPDVWLAAALVPTLAALGLMAAYLEATSQVGQGPGPRPPGMPLPPEITEGMGYVRRPFAFPQVWLTALGSGAPITLAVTFLAIATLAGEFTWGTVRTSLLSGTSRSQFIVARLTSLAVVTLGLLALTGLVATALSIVLGSFDRDLQAIEGPSMIGVIVVYGAVALTIGAFASLGLLLTVLTRSMVPATLLLAAYVLAESLVLGSDVWSGTPTGWAETFSLVGSTTGLVSEARRVAGDLTRVSDPLTTSPSGWVSLVAVTAWVLIPATLAVFHFRRTDVCE